MKYFIIFLSLFFLTSCTTEYDDLVKNQCQLTGNNEIRKIDTSYVMMVGDAPIYMPETTNITYYQYKCKNDQYYWSEDRYEMSHESQKTS